MTDPLDRIAAALERLAPAAPPSADPLAHPAYLWDGTSLTPARAFTPPPIDTLVNIDAQKTALLANLAHLSAGHAAHDVLLWGARGTGKSALLASGVAAVQAAGGNLALVQVVTDRLDSLPQLFRLLAPIARAFALFLDDIGFDAAGEARALRSLLEGGAEARPANVRLFVTSNRRHLVPRNLDEQSGAINQRDVVDDNLALSDRFGLSLGFHAIDQDTYVAIVAAHAARYGLDFDPAEAINWATRRGSRSGRVAWQYVVDLAGRSGRALQ